MVNLVFLVIVTLFLIICQTVILPTFSWFPQCFDLLITNILFLSLTHFHYGAIVGIVLIGGIMDSISGVPFFHHIFSYLWIYLIVQLFKQFVFQRSALFVILISVISVVIQQGMVLFSVFLDQGRGAVLQMDFSLMLKQVFWGGLFIPPGVWMINVLRQNYFYGLRQMNRAFDRRYRS